MKRALVLSLVLALGLGFAALAQGELSGTWNTEITIDPGATTIADFFDFSSSLTVLYEVGGWGFGTKLVVDDNGLANPVEFTAGGSFGAFNIGSKMLFDPIGGAFGSWEVDTSFLFGSVDIGVGFDLYGSNVGLALTGSASTGLVDIDIAMYFGDLYWDGTGWVDLDDICDFNWRGVDITIGFPFCCADVTATLSVTCEGFQELCFAVNGIGVSNMPWFALNAKLCFTPQTKTIKLTPVFDFGADLCIDVYLCTTGSNAVIAPLEVLSFPDISIVGLGLTCEIGGVSFQGLSWWGDTLCANMKPSVLGDYWEMYKISTTEDACCGPFDFSIAVFFDYLSTYLFDIAAFEADFSYALGDNFIFSMGLNYTAAGDTEWTIGFEITW